MKEVEIKVEEIFKYCSANANDPIVNIVSHQNGIVQHKDWWTAIWLIDLFFGSAFTLGQDSLSSDNYSLELQTQLDGPQNIVTEPPGLNMSSTNILESNDMLQTVINLDLTQKSP